MKTDMGQTMSVLETTNVFYTHGCSSFTKHIGTTCGVSNETTCVDNDLQGKRNNRYQVWFEACCKYCFTRESTIETV